MCDKRDNNNFMFFHTDHHMWNHMWMDFKFMQDFCYLVKPYCFFSRPNFKVFSWFLPQKINLKFIQNKFQNIYFAKCLSLSHGLFSAKTGSQGEPTRDSPVVSFFLR